LKLQFKLAYKNQEEKLLIDNFCTILLYDIKKDVTDNISPIKMKLKERDLFYAKWIKWNTNIGSLSINYILKLIIDNIIFTEKDNAGEFTIEINKEVYLPNSKTKLEVVARFINYGNEISPPTTFITSIFNKYQEEMKEYWEAYLYYNKEEAD